MTRCPAFQNLQLPNVDGDGKLGLWRASPAEFQLLHTLNIFSLLLSSPQFNKVRLDQLLWYASQWTLAVWATTSKQANNKISSIWVFFLPYLATFLTFLQFTKQYIPFFDFLSSEVSLWAPTWHHLALIRYFSAHFSWQTIGSNIIRSWNTPLFAILISLPLQYDSKFERRLSLRFTQS